MRIVLNQSAIFWFSPVLTLMPCSGVPGPSVISYWCQSLPLGLILKFRVYRTILVRVYKDHMQIGVQVGLGVRGGVRDDPRAMPKCENSYNFWTNCPIWTNEVSTDSEWIVETWNMSKQHNETKHFTDITFYVRKQENQSGSQLTNTPKNTVLYSALKRSPNGKWN